MLKVNELQKYVRLLAESHSKISEIERQELAGCLFYKDVQNPEPVFLDDLMNESDLFAMLELIAVHLFEDTEKTKENLLNCIKKTIIGFYSDKMDDLIKDEEDNIKQENSYNRDIKDINDY